MYEYKQDPVTGKWLPTTRIDEREFLKIKIKSLTAEARIIRDAEKHAHPASLRHSLYVHRVHTVRRAARETCLAYGYIRGVDLRQMEANAGTTNPAGLAWVNPDWVAIKKMITRYGPKNFAFGPEFEPGVGIKIDPNPTQVAAMVAKKLTAKPRVQRPLFQAIKNVVKKTFAPQKTDAELGVKSFMQR